MSSAPSTGTNGVRTTCGRERPAAALIRSMLIIPGNRKEDPSRISGHTLLMPIYEYWCEECRKRSSSLLPSYSSPDPPCPHCGKAGLRRLVSSFATISSGESDGGDDFDDGGSDDGGGGEDDFDGGDDSSDGGYGDGFNGDAAMDIAVVVRVKGRRVNLPKDVRVLNPFEDRTTAKFPDNPATANKLALVVIHSWKAPQPTSKFLLIGEAPILILEPDRATSSQPNDRKDLIELMSRRGKRRKGEKLPPRSKGDVIVLGSEVGDSVLYWNGRTYVWEDSPDD